MGTVHAPLDENVSLLAPMAGASGVGGELPIAGIEPHPAARAWAPWLVRITGEVGVWRAIALWWLASRACVFATALVVQDLKWPKESWYPALSVRPFALLTSWDGRWYRMVADRGYLVIPGHQSDTAFFPLLPILLRLGRSIGIPLNVTGLVVANAVFLVGLIGFFELARCWVPTSTAKRAAIYVAVFPLSYVFSMVYPESIVLAAIAIAAVCASRERWGAAACLAAVAALARPEALLLVLPLGVLAVRSWPALTTRARTSALVAVASAPAAVAGLCLYHWRTFGDPVAFSSAQEAWGRRTTGDGVYRAITELIHAPERHNTWLYRDAAFCVVYLLLLVVAARSVPLEWVVAATVIIILPLWTGSFTSEGRFGVLALPAFVGLAKITERRWIDAITRALSLALLIAATATILLRWP